MTVIHALPVAGGILAIAPLPGSDGDYAGDLEHIHGWAPALVISLTTDVEMLAGGAQNLGAQLQDQGTRWAHLPIADFGAPDAGFADKWTGISGQALQALAGRGRVLVHCRGGCGRSGMVALRLMIEAGEAADEALERLRTVRPCAIETDAQMEWALAAPRGAALFLRHPQ
ncbi:protein-tyrosine phosphatase family protein [Puniceibacterium sp. IMCC21224]|uniref:protein-tyrosine phosphatase family protein n=1 Tax=Puniceibacterium sp. IMCC21224 TaxID=1618204 RepID=UPI00064D81CE|nr:protein-tyrosine phosphatase family protein [Puniceibacterium sp. IMCC21224]KMK68525.1 Dual specificity phosphatase [Puniceibacterium sp. IMCC21224]